MKGVIIQCLSNLIQEKFGQEKWSDILEKSGLDRKHIFYAFEDIQDDVVINLFEASCEHLGLSMNQAADAFGDYWVNVFGKKIYGAYFVGKTSAKEFLLNMDKVHDVTTQNVENAHPPRFEYEDVDEKTLIMKYKSQRGLIDLFIGLIKGVGIYFNEDLQINKLNDNKVKIIFP